MSLLCSLKKEMLETIGCHHWFVVGGRDIIGEKIDHISPHGPDGSAMKEPIDRYGRTYCRGRGWVRWAWNATKRGKVIGQAPLYQNINGVPGVVQIAHEKDRLIGSGELVEHADGLIGR